MKKLLIFAVISILLLFPAVSAINTNFVGNPLTGSSPLQVSFSDTSSDSPTIWAWFFGDEPYNQSWTQQTANAEFQFRKGHGSVALPDGSIVVIGGHSGSGYLNNVWRSTNDGVTWTQMTASAGWSGRLEFGCVALPDGSIVIFGGDGGFGGGYYNDTWRSTDKGATWTLMTGGAEWSKRLKPGGTVLPDGSIVIMGGYDGSGYLNDVWRSTDKGATWIRKNASAAWSPRWSPNVVALPDGNIVMIGGQYGWPGEKTDVWRSTDQGVIWTQMTAVAEWPARYLQSTVAMPDGSIVMMGGVYGEGDVYSDVWRSINQGANWTLLSGTSGWSNRQGHSSALLPNGKIILTGGYGNSGTQKDAWIFSPQGSNVQNPIHSYPTIGDYSVALMASNATATNSTLKTDYISVEEYVPPPINANFTSNTTVGIVPQPVQFNDTTTGTPTIWSWFFGDESYNQSWTEQNASPGWSARYLFSAISLSDNSIIVLGGIGDAYYNDVWRSTDKGVTWVEQNASSGWGVRDGHTSVVLSDNSIVLMGGTDGATLLNDTWRSTDKGVTWVEQNASSGWLPRYGHTSIALDDDSIITMGGQGDTIILNDVWRSTDKGVTWVEQNANPIWEARYHHQSVVSPDDSIILFGGDGITGNYSCYISTDKGITWEEIIPEGGNIFLQGMTGVGMPNGDLVIMSGADEVGTPLNKTWLSKDQGVTWIPLPDAGWSPRYYGESTVLPEGDIIILGGIMGSSYGNDVWKLSPQGSTSQNPVHTYTNTGLYSISLTASSSTSVDSEFKLNYINVTAYPFTPVAEFYSNITRGAIPLTVQFMDSSTNSPASWLWDFGDSTNSTDQNPTHTYNLNGTFDVSLTVGKSGNFNSTTKSSYITASADPPTSNFMAIPIEGDYPLTVNLYDQSTNTPTTWDWDFGDGTAHATVQNPTHTYMFENQYTVKLVVSNTYGVSDLTKPYYIDVTAIEGQMLTRPVNVNLSSNCIKFDGTNLGEPITVWFEYGMIQSYTNGYKTFKTENQTGVTGNFSYTHCGIPLLPGEAYKVHAAGDIGGVYVYGMNRTFVIPDRVPHPSMTYEEQVDIFVEDGLDPISLLTYDIWQPYLGLMGGLFFAILIAFIFMNIVIKQRTVSLTIIVLLLTGVAVWRLLPPAFIQIAQMLFIAGIAGILYWLFVKRR